MILAVPLAWLQLTYEKSRLLVAIAGIMFAVILMFMQLGFQDALFKSAIRLQSNLHGDLVIISPQSTNLVGMRNFSQRRLYQTLGIEGVESVNSLYIGLGAWKIPTIDPNASKHAEDLPEVLPPGSTRSILVLGVDPNAKVFNLPGVDAESLEKVKTQDVALFDQTSRAEFGRNIVAQFKRGETINREVANRKITIEGLFTLGSSFAADGAIITSDLNFLRIFDARRPGLINVGLINLKPGTDPYAVMKKIIAMVPADHVTVNRPDKQVQKVKDQLNLEDFKIEDITVDDIRVLTAKGFINFERSYWQKGTAIGFIFTLGTIMGFIVGIVIVYQILYTDVSDHIAEYATLKAMGYSNFYLSKIVLQEAFVLSILGFIPGFCVCIGLYALTRNATRLPLDMTIERGIQVLILTMIMCTISGAVSLRKVQSADPAEIFA
jgi:putative ABC transport system permease protein